MAELNVEYLCSTSQPYLGTVHLFRAYLPTSGSVAMRWVTDGLSVGSMGRMRTVALVYPFGDETRDRASFDPNEVPLKDCVEVPKAHSLKQILENCKEVSSLGRILVNHDIFNKMNESSTQIDKFLADPSCTLDQMKRLLPVFYQRDIDSLVHLRTVGLPMLMKDADGEVSRRTVKCEELPLPSVVTPDPVPRPIPINLFTEPELPSPQPREGTILSSILSTHHRSHSGSRGLSSPGKWEEILSDKDERASPRIQQQRSPIVYSKDYSASPRHISPTASKISHAQRRATSTTSSSNQVYEVQPHVHFPTVYRGLQTPPVPEGLGIAMRKSEPRDGYRSPRSPPEEYRHRSANREGSVNCIVPPGLWNRRGESETRLVSSGVHVKAGAGGPFNSHSPQDRNFHVPVSQSAKSKNVSHLSPAHAETTLFRRSAESPKKPPKMAAASPPAPAVLTRKVNLTRSPRRRKELI